MDTSIRRISKVVIAVTVLLALLGGVFFGLYSCGGYVWHQQIFTITFGGSVCLSVLLPSVVLRKFFTRITFSVVVVLLFLIVQAVAATFYPAPPGSWAKFSSSFLSHMEFGPC